MASSFSDSFDQLAGDSTRSFDDDGYFGYDPRLASQQFDSVSNFSDPDSIKQSALDDSSTAFPPAVHVSGGGFPADPSEFSSLSPEEGKGGFGGPILSPPAVMEPEDGVALREWRRANLIRLAEKEKREKESLSQIIDEAEEYKVEFYKKRTVSCEANKGTNREREKLFVVSHEKFHAEAAKTYWKAIAELIPKEVPAIEKKRGKKEQDKNALSVAVMRGPKPGKPTDLSRMRHILLKLKHNTPPHLEHMPPPPAPPAVDSETGAAAASAPPTTNAGAVSTTHVEAVAVA